MGDHTLHCSGCESSVRFVLSMLEGIQHVEADHRIQRIDVTYEETKVDRQEIAAELAGLGYRVEPLVG